MSNHKKVFGLAFKAWLPFAVTILVLSGLVYAAVQQNYRTSANDPQIQVAQDISSAISEGQTSPDTIVSAEPTTDIAQSLSTFVAIYNATTTPIGSSVSLNGKLPTLPSGVFDYAKTHPDDRFTWQPQAGVRIAAVLKYFGGATPGYVLAGRSIKEVEVRENQLMYISVIGAIVGLILTYLVILLMLINENPRPNHEHEQHEHTEHEHKEIKS